MNLKDIKSKLAPQLKKSDIVDELGALVASVPSLMTLTRQWGDVLDKRKPADVHQNINKKILSYMRNTPGKNNNLPGYCYTVFPQVGLNIDTVEAYVIDKFPVILITETLSVKQLHAILYMHMMGEVRRYLPELITAQLKSVGTSLSNEPVYEPNPRILSMLQDNAFNFAISLDALSLDKATFSARFSALPEVEASNGNLAALSSIPEYNDPSLRLQSGFNGNPIFAFRKWLNTLTVDRIRYLQSKVTQAKLLREELMKELNNNGSPAIINELALLDDEIGDLEYKIARAER